jgi:hypothetical protein
MQGTMQKDAILVICCIGLMLIFVIGDGQSPKSPIVFAGILAISIAMRMFYRDYKAQQKSAAAISQK